jgi:predicted transcriptional regulator
MGQSPLHKTRIITDKEAENITRVEELAYDLKVREVMTANPVVMSPDLKMEAVLEQFRQLRISGAPIVDNDQLIGIISIEDLIRCLIKSDLQAEIHSYMSRDPIIVQGNDPVVEALKCSLPPRSDVYQWSMKKVP